MNGFLTLIISWITGATLATGLVSSFIHNSYYEKCSNKTEFHEDTKYEKRIYRCEMIRTEPMK